MSLHTAASDYRPDIDGLRAIAVLAVMLHHASAAALPGGFVGVDIFFVISGYLISKHIAAQVMAGRFSLLEFYRRRIRRIAPVMLVVVAATLAAALVLMTPEDARAVAKSAVWSIASLANVHFWRDIDSGYFAASSAELPLLHLWSLGVEEQFYMLWPVLLALALRGLRPTNVVAASTVLALLSFALAVQWFPRDASFVYYMLPTRMGELLLGALLGIAMAGTSWRPGPKLARAAAWFGTLLVVSSLAAIDRHQPFPGWLALPPTMGAALLILAGEGGSHPLTGLSSPPMVWLGKVSYSAYLWHWPIFAFFRYGWGEPGWAACLAIMSATLLLAWLSWRFVEQPTRSSNASFGAVAWRQFVVPAVLIMLPALAVVYAARLGLPLGDDGYLARLEQVRQNTRPAFTFDWACQRQRLAVADLQDPRCVLGANTENEPDVLLWGDSNAAHYVPMLQALAVYAGTRFRNVAVGACPPLLLDPSAYVDARRLDDCLASAALVAAELPRYRVVVISAAWSTYVARSPALVDDVDALVRALTQRGQVVVLIGRAPVLSNFEPRCAERALRLPLRECPESAEPLAAAVVEVNRRLRDLAAATPGASYFDANGYLCRGGTCGRRTLQGLPRYLDASHLTVTGSRELGQAIVAAEGLPPALDSLRR